MLDESNAWSKKTRINLETDLEALHCRCTEGHRFAGEIYSTINTQTDPDALDALGAAGTQRLKCPVCGTDCTMAEPVTLHDPRNGRFALLVPEVLSHREIELRAALTNALARADKQVIPVYLAEFRILTGSRELAEWRQVPRSSQWPEPPSLAARPQPGSPTGGTPPGMKNPGLHEAFADLADRDSEPAMAHPARTPSHMPAPDYEYEEQDDWLDDAALSAAEQALSSGLLSPFNLEKGPGTEPKGTHRKGHGSSQNPKDHINAAKNDSPTKKFQDN
jgi:hypothetical protein